MIQDNWYKKLKKAPWTPPPYVFGIVWTILYILMAISIYLVWSNKKCYPYCEELNIFFLQLFLNIIWTTIFFKFKMPFLAFIDIILLLLVVGNTYKKFYKIDKLSAYLLIPYLLWLLVAFTLNGYIIVMN